MKSLLVSVILSFLLSLCSLGCAEKENIIPSKLCPNAGAFVRRVKQVTGTVYYDQTRNSYGIQIPTSMDSADMGLACNLPVDYQREMKKVVFSGSYYEYDKSVTGPVGYRYYFLTVESISSL